MMNAMRPSEIRMMYQREPNKTRVKCLTDEKDITSKVLQNLGVENLYLFFAKTILLVEGETEETFIPNYHYKAYGESLSSRLIRIINVKGIQNIYGFSKGILELHSADSILALYDNDALPETLALIDSLAITKENRFVLGNKEFEDSFSSEVIHRSWRSHLEAIGRTIPEEWKIGNIENMREEAIADPSKKFSTMIKQLNKGSGTQLTKPILGGAIAEYITDTEIPEILKNLFSRLRSCS
jgi:hypothetical protein